MGFETGMLLKNVKSFADVAQAYYNEKHNSEKKDIEKKVWEDKETHNCFMEFGRRLLLQETRNNWTRDRYIPC